MSGIPQGTVIGPSLYPIHQLPYLNVLKNRLFFLADSATVRRGPPRSGGLHHGPLEFRRMADSAKVR